MLREDVAYLLEIKENENCTFAALYFILSLNRISQAFGSGCCFHWIEANREFDF